MLIHLIEHDGHTPQSTGAYRKGLCQRHPQTGSMVIQIVVDSRPPFFIAYGQDASDAVDAVTHMQAVEQDYPNAEVYGEFSKEAMAALKEAGYVINTMDHDLFHAVKHIQVEALCDLNDVCPDQGTIAYVVETDEGWFPHGLEGPNIRRVLANCHPNTPKEKFYQLMELVSREHPKATIGYFTADAPKLAEQMLEDGIVVRTTEW